MAERWQCLVRSGYLEDSCWTIWNISVDNEIMYGVFIGLVFIGLYREEPGLTRRRRRRTRPSHPTRRSRRIARNRPRRSLRIQMMRWELQWGPPGVPTAVFTATKMIKEYLWNFLNDRPLFHKSDPKPGNEVQFFTLIFNLKMWNSRLSCHFWLFLSPFYKLCPLRRNFSIFQAK